MGKTVQLKADYTDYQFDNKWSRVALRKLDDEGFITESLWTLMLTNCGLVIRILREDTTKDISDQGRILSDVMTFAPYAGIAVRETDLEGKEDKRCQLMGPGQQMMPQIIQAAGMPPGFPGMPGVIGGRKK